MNLKKFVLEQLSTLPEDIHLEYEMVEDKITISTWKKTYFYLIEELIDKICKDKKHKVTYDSVEKTDIGVYRFVVIRKQDNIKGVMK